MDLSEKGLLSLLSDKLGIKNPPFITRYKPCSPPCPHISQSQLRRRVVAAAKSNLPRSLSRRNDRLQGAWPLASAANELANHLGRCLETKVRLPLVRRQLLPLPATQLNQKRKLSGGRVRFRGAA